MWGGCGVGCNYVIYDVATYVSSRHSRILYYVYVYTHIYSHILTYTLHLKRPADATD